MVPRVLQITENELCREHRNLDDHQNNLCIAVLSIIPLRKNFIFDEGYFYSGSFQKYSRTSVQNSRTSQEVSRISHNFSIFKDFSRTSCSFNDFSRSLRTMTKVWINKTTS